MSKLWKIILIIIVFLLLGLLLHYGIFEKIVERTPLVKNIYQNSLLTVNTRRGVAKISLNGIDYGQTPQTITNLSEGEYLVELEKISETTIYPKETFFIELHRNTEAVIDIEIAPGGFKSGHILYYSPMPKALSKNGALTLRGDIKNYDIFINDSKVDPEEILSYQLTPNEYDIKVVAKGYESLEFPIIIREGYNLNVRVYLLPIPIAF